MLIILNLPLRALMRSLAFWLVLALAISESIFVARVCLDPAFSGVDRLAGFFNLSLSADPLSLVVLFSIGLVVAVTLMVARQTVPSANQLFIFSNMLLLVLAGMNGVVLTKDIFSLYVFLEITAVASFILIAFYKDIDALEGAFKYIILSAVATALMLCAIAIFVMFSGTTAFSGISAALIVSPYRTLLMSAVAVFLGGLFIKAGLMPFHGWLPDAYSAAPAPVSVLLAGIVTKVVGIYTLIRLAVSVFGINHSAAQLFLLVGAVSVVLAALAALGQTDFKRMLAYSSISQVGYIVLALGCASGLGVAAAAFHLFNHVVFKSLLFVNATAVETQAGTRDLTRMGGIAQKMPVTGLTSALASLSASGIPPLAGFWSKLLIIIALWTSGNHIYALIAVLASVLTLSYFLYLQREAFFGKLVAEFSALKEAGWGITFPSLVLGAIIVAVGVFFPFVLKNFILPVSNIFGG